MSNKKGKNYDSETIVEITNDQVHVVHSWGDSKDLEKDYDAQIEYRVPKDSNISFDSSINVEKNKKKSWRDKIHFILNRD